MIRRFKTVDYKATLDSSVRLGDCLPQEHLARFIAEIIELLDFNPIYKTYANRGAAPYAPEILIGLLFYAYATGVFSSRKIERATRETAPFRYLAGNFSPDHDTISNFRKQFEPQIKELFLQILLLFSELGVLDIGNLHIDGTKIHADASKSKAVSYKRLLEIESRLKAEIAQLLLLAESADSVIPEGMSVPKEISLREDRLNRLLEAKTVLQERADFRYKTEQDEYEAKLKERAEKEEKSGKKPRGKPPTPPSSEPKDKDQYNFTDPESRIMKNSSDSGYDQHYNGQIAVDEKSRLIVGFSLSNHANDQHEVAPTLESISKELGSVKVAVLDAGFFSQANIDALKSREIDPYIATGRDPHNKGWEYHFEDAGEAPAENATAKVKMAYKLRTKIGRAIYRCRKFTVEPVFGNIKEAMGFRQFSLRGLTAAAGEWCLVCLAYNLRRLHVLTNA